MRYAMGVEYDGSAYRGWQQLGEAGGPTLQATLEAALSRVAATPIATVCAGRTDAGVHGRCQVVHFDSTVIRTARGWTLGTTANLPPDMAALWCVEVDDDFHARFSAVARRYRYRILNRSVRPALRAAFSGWEWLPLDAAFMHDEAQSLLGEQDFSSFRAAQCQSRHARRHLQEIRVTRVDDHVIVEVQANAFLHHMVRNIVGSLLLVGRHERPAGWLADLLAARDRTLAGPTAPAAGLTFLGPRYPAACRLPAAVTA